MKAVDNRVIIKVTKNEGAVTKIGNFEIPEDSKEYETAEVIAVGPNVGDGINVGDKAYIYTGAGKKFRIEGVEYRSISLSEIIVII